jgi:uncharacterized protein
LAIGFTKTGSSVAWSAPQFAALRHLQFNHSDFARPHRFGTRQRSPRHGRPRNVKFQPDFLDGTNTIARHDGARVWVGTQSYTGSIVVPWSGAVRPWAPGRFDELTQPHFDDLLHDGPELVIFGSGARLRFPKPALLRSLIERRVGFETMDTAAACRTYNVLVSEGRSVIAALLFETP